MALGLTHTYTRDVTLVADFILYVQNTNDLWIISLRYWCYCAFFVRHLCETYVEIVGMWRKMLLCH